MALGRTLLKAAVEIAARLHWGLRLSIPHSFMKSQEFYVSQSETFAKSASTKQPRN